MVLQIFVFIHYVYIQSRCSQVDANNMLYVKALYAIMGINYEVEQKTTLVKHQSMNSTSKAITNQIYRYIYIRRKYYIYLAPLSTVNQTMLMVTVEAQLAEVRGSNPVFDKFSIYHLFTVNFIEKTKNKEKRARMAPFSTLKVRCW